MFSPGMNPFARQMEERRKKIQENLGKIKCKIAVMSGKGGVGKTTVAVNLAAMLAEKGKTGILDADIDCPNVNRFLGIKERMAMHGEKTIIPVEKYGLKIVSMASLQEAEDTAIMWRGPLIANTLAQFLENTKWGELDFLVFDCPPGTSDVAMSLMQNAGITGIAVVSTPQSVSIIDAQKAINMAKQFNVKIFGLIENMSGEIFGKGTVEKMAKKIGQNFLGQITLDKKIADYSERGQVAAMENKEIRIQFEKIAQNIFKQLPSEK